MSKILNEFKNQNGLIPDTTLLSLIDKDIASYDRHLKITSRMLELGPEHADFSTLQIQLQQSIDALFK